jgi:predicted nucleic acid-binding protein
MTGLARRIVRQLVLQCTGTIAVLIQTKKHGFVPWVGDRPDQLSATGFFLTDALAEAARRQAGE